MKTIKIGAHNVTLKLPYSFPKQDAIAMVDLDKKVIVMEGGYPVAVTLSSLLHEILHMIDYQGALGLWGRDVDEAGTEEKIDALAEALTQVLIDNKMINPNFMAMLKRESAKKSK